MACKLEVLYTPAEFRALAGRDLSRAVCVVFDVLRATSTFVTALANGAAGVVPVAEISEALAWRQKQRDVLLAGERDGLRIPKSLTEGVEFDLGNSPREFTRERVGGRLIVSTTTNGTRALRACAGGKLVVLGSLLDLSATAEFLARQTPEELLLVCAGTGEGLALEDVLAAGGMCDALAGKIAELESDDSAEMAHTVFLQALPDFAGAVKRAKNARRLLAHRQLSGDVEFCLRQDVFDFVAICERDGVVRRKV